MRLMVCAFIIPVTALVTLSLVGTYYLFLFDALPNNFIIWDGLVLLCMSLPGFAVYRSRNNFSSIIKKEVMSGRFKKWLYGSFALLLVIQLMVFFMLSLQAPHGEWDAQAIWNLHARFLYRGMNGWNDYLTPILHWSHPDYPLLVPALIARGWSLIDLESTAVPILVAFIFTFSTVGLLTYAVGIITHVKIGVLAGVLLLGTPSYIALGASQYADVPLSYFYLCWAVLLSLHWKTKRGHLFLMSAFLMAACAAWTKNEGILFLLVACLTYFGRAIVQGRRGKVIRKFIMILLAMLPVLLLVAVFKLNYAPSNDVLGNQGVSIMLDKITDWHRYIQIGRSFVGEFVLFNNGGLLLLLFFILVSQPKLVITADIQFLGCVFCMLVIGYFCVYLVSPRNLYFHLGNSLDRLYLQLWPLALFIIFTSFDWTELNQKI